MGTWVFIQQRFSISFYYDVRIIGWFARCVKRVVVTVGEGKGTTVAVDLHKSMTSFISNSTFICMTLSWLKIIKKYGRVIITKASLQLQRVKSCLQ